MERKLDKLILRIKLAAMFVIAILLAAPIGFYIYTFGYEISSDHQRWGEMGSAMSGIYTPILSILTLVVLVVQVLLQSKTNAHEFDQAYIQEAREDIEYYVEQLEKELCKCANEDKTVREYLHELFGKQEINILLSSQMLKVAKELNVLHPRVCSIWLAIYPVLMGLSTPKQSPYEHNFQSALQKILAMASWQTCAALDQYVWCLSEGSLDYQFQFSTKLSGSGGKD